MTRIYQCDELESLTNFTVHMARQLNANTHKSGWRQCTTKALFKRLHEEIAELEDAIKKGKPYAAIAREAADVANFAMMIQDIFWGKP